MEDLLNQAQEACRTDPRLSVEICTRARDLAEAAGLARLRIEAVTSIGISHYLLGEYHLALRDYQESEALAENLGDRTLLADALNNIGVLHFIWGEYEDALKYYFRALSIRLDMNDNHGIAQGYNNVANIHHATGDYDQALKYYRKSLESYTAEADTAMIISTMNNIGLAYFEQGRFEDSLDQYSQALGLEKSFADKAGMAMTLNNMGQVHEARGALDEALPSYRKALEMRQDLEDRQGISVCLHNIGTVLVKQGKYDAGIDTLRKALARTEALQIRELIRDNLEALAEAYEESGDPARALAFYKRFKAAHDDLFNEERSRQIALAQTRFEVDLKDREIQVLKREAEIERSRRRLLLVVAGLAVVIILLLLNRYLFQRSAHRQIARVNAALRTAHDELEQATRNELAHVARVATMGELTAAFAHELNQPLAAIRANARAGANFLADDKRDLGEVDAALADIGEDAERAQDLILHLREMMRKGETRREPVDMNRALRDVVAMIGIEAERLGVHVSLHLSPELPTISGDRIQLQQVALNLIQNGLSAMSDAPGELVVESSPTPAGGVRVQVQDSGAPVPPEVLADMFEPFFTTKQDGLGMGLPICRTIIEAHGGHMEAIPRPGGGLVVSLELPPREEESG